VPRAFLPLLFVLFIFGTCTPNGGAEPAGAESPRTERTGDPRADAPAVADTLVARDGGEVRLGEPMRSRVLAEDPLWERALRVHYDAIVMDGHIDTPTHMLDSGYQLGQRNPTHASSGHVDLPKMIEGGLDAPFFVIYVARGYGEGQSATNRALSMIAEVKRQVNALDGIEMAYTAEDIIRITRAGRKAAIMGLEGGHAIQASEEVLRQLAAEGIRYIGITHTNSHSWADSSQDRERHGGLSDRGRELVREMNRLGVLVDLSHASDNAFFDAVEVSAAPVIFSHSSVRALVDNPRNVTDEMLLRLRDNGGVIMINFFDPTINSGLTSDVMNEVYRRIDTQHGGDLRTLWQIIGQVRAERGIPRGTVSDIVDHIDYVKNLIGIDHVALGSDFDGVHSLPRGMENAARLPFITYEMMRRGYSDDEVRKVLGGNTLRVLAEAEQVARVLQAEAVAR
jgi:membrane dipeptidase